MSDNKEIIEEGNAATELSELSNREEHNSAIGSWSGYIYQGLCGILVVLRMINENREAYHEYSLQLDAFEDFSIFDGENKIYSLHQCKSIKDKDDYEKEFSKIKEKVEKNRSILQDPDNPLYFFHCNVKVKIKEEYGIRAYPFTVEKSFCEPGEIQQLLNTEINRLKHPESNTESIRAALETMVNSEVLDTQQVYFDAKPSERLWKIARKQKMPFAWFEDILDSEIIKFSAGDFLNQVKSSYILELESIAADDGEEAQSLVFDFINRLNAMTPIEFKAFIQRINPKEKVVETHECWHEIASKERIHWLYNLITEIPLEDEVLHWKTTNSLQTPSTLGNDEKIEKQCVKINANQANLDFPWIYDWIVGHVDEHVDDIFDVANIIPTTDEEGRSIFQTKRLGILTKKEKKDGKFD